MNPNQLRELIHTVLKLFGYYSREAVDLLMLTAAQETHCGKYIRQLGGGPALGIFQMEPRTLTDIIDNFLAYRSDLYDQLNQFLTKGNLPLNLTGNLLFQIAVARVHYLRVKEPVPKRTNFDEEYTYIKALAGYWKRHWNTAAGAGTVQEAIDNYNRYVRRSAA